MWTTKGKETQWALWMEPDNFLIHVLWSKFFFAHMHMKHIVRTNLNLVYKYAPWQKRENVAIWSFFIFTNFILSVGQLIYIVNSIHSIWSPGQMPFVSKFMGKIILVLSDGIDIWKDEINIAAKGTMCFDYIFVPVIVIIIFTNML